MQADTHNQPGDEQQPQICRKHEQISRADRNEEPPKKPKLSRLAVEVAQGESECRCPNRCNQEREQRAEAVNHHAPEQHSLRSDRLPNEQAH